MFPRGPLTLTGTAAEIRLPGSITTRPGQTRVTFKAYVEPTAKQQTAEIAIQFGQTVARAALPVEPGRAPVLSLPGEMATRFDEAVSFTVSSIDPDGLPVVYATEGLPAGASFDPGREHSPGRLVHTSTANMTSCSRRRTQPRPLQQAM